jgi:hypothetical protein
MELNLHANAATTPKTRAYIQRSKRPVRDLAAELGVSETTRSRGRRGERLKNKLRYLRRASADLKSRQNKKKR